MQYVFDTNAWICAWKERYWPDRFPLVWERLDNAVNKGVIVSPPDVCDEVKYPESLAQWMKERRGALELPMRGAQCAREVETEIARLVGEYPDLSDWSDVSDASKNPFTDYGVVAWAKILNRAVVTEEKRKRDRNAADKKIPDVCDKERIKCFSTQEFMGRERMID